MIIQLIQALYDPCYYFPGDNRSYELALEDIEYFAIAPQIYHFMKQQNRLDAAPEWFRDRLERAYRETVCQNLFIKSETEKIFFAFEEAGIDVIPLKGVAFAEKYFGHLGARGTSDIDLLVRASDVNEAEACVKSLGFTIEGEAIPSHFHSSFAKPLPGTSFPLAVELHWNMLSDHTSGFSIDELWRHAEPFRSYGHVFELSDYHTFYMICLHGWKHALDSMKYFIDMIQLLHTAGHAVDYETMLRDAASHRTLRRMIHTLSIVYRQFPHLNTVKPFPQQKKTRLWWDYNAIRDKKTKTFLHYVRLAQYQLMEYDTPMHSFAATKQYLRSILKR